MMIDFTDINTEYIKISLKGGWRCDNADHLKT